MSIATQCRKLGLQIGDTIEGREEYPGGWSEARLTLLWLGEEVAAWRVTERSSSHPEWSEPEESADWTLECREWRKLELAAAPAALRAALEAQGESLNLSDRSVQRRLAAQWGYAPADVQQEPVAELIIDDLHALHDTEMISENDSGAALIRLNDAVAVVEEHLATPPARKPLTDHALWANDDLMSVNAEVGFKMQDIIKIARAIERAHGIGGRNE